MITKLTDHRLHMIQSYDLFVTYRSFDVIFDFNRIFVCKSFLSSKLQLNSIPTYFFWLYKATKALILWFQSLLMICFQLESWQWLFIKRKNTSTTSEAINLFRTIMICMNWQDTETAWCSRLVLWKRKTSVLDYPLWNGMEEVSKSPIRLDTYL